MVAPVNRFAFQVWCCQQTDGKVLNIGCKEDPAKLGRLFADRGVVNADRHDYDEDVYKRTGERVPIPVDVVCDMASIPWPFGDGEFGIVVLADVLEDLPDDGCQVTILREARRVADHLCVTCPEDTPARDPHHRTTITRRRILDWLGETGWRWSVVEDGQYPFVPRGTYVFADRAADGVMR